MTTKDTLWKVNFFYMLAFILTGVLFGLSSVLCKALAVGSTETILLTTIAAQFAPAAAMLITRLKYRPQPKLSFGPPSLLALFLCILVPAIALLSQHFLQAALDHPLIPSLFFVSLPMVMLT